MSSAVWTQRASAVTRGIAVALLAVLQLAWPSAAWAHAHLKRSDPGAGARVVAPAVLRLWFTEAPELVETHVTLLDSVGIPVPLGAVERDADGPLALRVRIPSPLAPGAYQVRWSTAATDGHPSHGTFAFVVLPTSRAPSAAPSAARVVAPAVAPAPTSHGSVSERTPDASAPASPDARTPAYVAARAVSYAALLAVIGAVVFRVAVLGRAPAVDAGARDGMAARAAGVAAWASVLLVAGAVARLVVQTTMMYGRAALDAAHLRTMVMGTHWGTAWIVQIAAAVVGFTGFVVARRGRAPGWVAAGAAATALAVTPALSGHAAAAPRFTRLAILTDALHVFGAAGWLGSLLFVAAVGVPVAVAHTRPPPGDRARDDRWAAVASLVHAFSPTALACASLLALTGVVSAWLGLGSVPALWTSGYGRVLLVKLALLAGVATIGASNWRRVRPALGTEAATTRLRRAVALELGIGLLVVIATAVLVATPTPTPMDGG